jgi:hypothetical protein
VPGSVAAQTAPVTADSGLRVCQVQRKVADFPTNEDLSTPEAAYANLNRKVVAQGLDVFSALSTRAVRQSTEQDPQARRFKGKPLPKERAAQYAAAEVLEVWSSDSHACVIAKLPGPNQTSRFDARSFDFEDGHWLNSGEGIEDTLQAAQDSARKALAYAQAQEKSRRRPPIANPDQYLRPFVDFLHSSAQEPRQFLLPALANHRLVILGEVHHRPRYWAFNNSLVREKDFAERVGVIYLELPGNDQALIERFFAGQEYDPHPVIEMLRDNLWMGWPDQAMLDFFKTVWEANQSLPPEHRLRLVLVDMPRPWKDIKSREDWRKYEGDRDEIMAANIQHDLREHAADRRHALFIVGWMHATRHVALPGGEPVKSAGWRLREELGATNVFAIFPHCPVMSNNGDVQGRLAQGLFETAFGALTNRPMAFPLDRGPFGQQPFDAPSLDYLTTSSYSAAFDAYLYLGPLEDEVFSPLIPGFYTDEFVLELDRRHRLDSGHGLIEACGFSKLDAENFIVWMSRTWGQPRREWSAFRLGPLDAWQRGDQPAKGSVAKSSWASKGQATPEAALESMLWAMNQGDLQSFLPCLPPGSHLSAQEFDDAQAKARATMAFEIVSSERISDSEVILGVDFDLGTKHRRVPVTMRKLEGRWRYLEAAEVDRKSP